MGIKVLPPEVVSRIAAGEVVERPASVVKELVENSLDAGAGRITVEIRGGGVKLIRVTDDGCGIPLSEVELAFQRHATAKIGSAADLENISTLGFRGEALPAIAAVAEVEMFTRAREEPAGTFISLRENKIVERVSRGRPPGTTVTVRNLFHSVPARLRFLKSRTTEVNHIIETVTNYALAFPEVKFNLYIEGSPVLQTSGDGDLKQTLMEILGLEVAEEVREMAPVEEGELRLTGLLGNPSLNYSGRTYLRIFVNRRPVRSPRLAHAVEEAYSDLIPPDRHPLAFVFISLPSREVDVNVHPAKAEVRFKNENRVVEALRRAVAGTLGTAVQPQLQAEPAQAMALPASLPVLRVLGQLSTSYIIAEGPDGLYLIDQHTAHERVLYEKILKGWRERNLESQGLLEPMLLELSPQEERMLRRNWGELLSYGFSLEPFGPGTYLVRAVPAVLKGRDIAGAIKEILGLLSGERRWEESIAASLACHGAVKAGQVLSPEEMKELVRELEQLGSRTCPHGRPILLHISSEFLEREFGRR